MGLKINDIAYYLPENILTNEELIKHNPTWTIESLEKRIGIKKRHISKKGETSLDLSIEASKLLFKKHSDLTEKIDGLIYCSTTEDYVAPRNACLFQNALNLSEDIIAIDLAIGCSGFIYALAIAQGFLQTRIASNILVVTADTYQKFCNMHDRAAKPVFGDAGAVTWISASNITQGLLDIQCGVKGGLYDAALIAAGNCRIPKSETTAIPKTDSVGNTRTIEDCKIDGSRLIEYLSIKIPGQIRQILNRNNFSIEDINLFIFHQSSKIILDLFERLIKIKPEKNFRTLQEIGNTSSASIPISLKMAIDKDKISKGDKIILSSFGTGLYFATAIYEW
ncbi:3-oxoacyl-(acyl-carrier-protein) synthase III [Candidatus Magnetomorum sp. HK-1]|nr:3-oxoacyl-(acyl-carrier-protein) synthase III [Candidatus Magnetomorum sp. HK-1]